VILGNTVYEDLKWSVVVVGGGGEIVVETGLADGRAARWCRRGQKEGAGWLLLN
jgi:hypothetical protein